MSERYASTAVVIVAGLSLLGVNVAMGFKPFGTPSSISVAPEASGIVLSLPGVNVAPPAVQGVVDVAVHAAAKASGELPANAAASPTNEAVNSPTFISRSLPASAGKMDFIYS